MSDTKPTLAQRATKIAAAIGQKLGRKAASQPTQSGDSPVIPAPAPVPALDAARFAIEAVHDQRAFEKTHPVPFAPDQRQRATLQRVAMCGVPISSEIECAVRELLTDPHNGKE